MNTGSDLVIYQAKAAISKACEGRKCLADCLRRIERAEVGKLPPAPSAAHGAKAAKRTPDAMRVHPAARVRAVAGAARAAWRAFAFRARSARGRVAVMLRALSARLSAILRPLIRAIAAVALTLGVTCPAIRAAMCVWNGSGYTCNGEGGSYVLVTGGGGGEGDTIVITNIVGTCTNCVAMSPEYVRNWKSSMSDQLTEQQNKIYKIAYTDVPNIRNALIPYAEKYPLPDGVYFGTSSVNAQYQHNTNELVRLCGNYQPPFTIDNKAVRAASSITVLGGSSQSAKVASYLTAYNAAATAYNDVADAVIQATNDLQGVYQSAVQVSDRLTTLKLFTIPQLSEEECTAQWDGPSSITPDHGSGVVTNQVTGNWCTYEQGQMMLETLHAVDEWIEKEENYLKSITNWVAVVNATIVANLNTSYSAIPSSENLGGDWREVYLAGQRTQWGYEPTNILARVELLLYGLSGVGTNSTDVAEETGIDPTDADTAGDDEAAALEDLAIDGTGPARDFGTISDALGRFYARFSSLTGSQFAGQQVSASYSVEIGEQRYDVSAFQLDTQHSRIANTAQLMCRSFLVILYLLAAAYAGFRFYAVFLAFVVKYAKWAQELLSSLFAD